MKLYKLFIAGGVMAASMSLTSCVGDLDLEPTSPNDITVGTFEQDPEMYMRQVFADVFFQCSTFGVNGNNTLSSMDGGMSTFQRAVFNMEEVPTDEADWLPQSDVIPWNWQFGILTSTDAPVMGTYSRMMVISTLCNQFIQEDFKLKTPEQEALREEFVRQVKIIRSAMYFYLVSEYGNVPMNDETVAVGTVAPQLSTDFKTGRRLVTEKVVNTLEEIVAWYKANDPNNKPPYGYVGLDVAESLLVKFYLNYEVFTGTPAWDKCYQHAVAVINRMQGQGFVASDGVSTGLAYDYFQNFSYNNRDQHEIIWRIVSQNADTNKEMTGVDAGVINWANGGFMIMAWIGGDLLNYYNTGNGWKCMVARTQLVEAFEDWDASWGTCPDYRVKWWQTSANGRTRLNPTMTLDTWEETGYLPVKYVNWYIDDNGATQTTLSPASGSTTETVCLDYGMIRLAEIYLSAAEAALNGAASNDIALQYTNYIRERAKLEPWSTINLTTLRQERQRELYTECVRRTDLIRYGQWISGYNWNWKYGVADGTDYPSNMNVYPLPATVVQLNGYTQNPGW